MGKLNFMIISCVVLVAIYGVQGTSVLSGSVFCDQCKDGEVTRYRPLWGIKLAMVCLVRGSQIMTVGNFTTNMFGNYDVTINDRSPDLSKCYVKLLPDCDRQPAGLNSQCGSATPVNSLELVKHVFGRSDTWALYNVDPIIFQPAQPMRFCSSRVTSIPPSAIPVSLSTPMHGEAPLLDDTACPYNYWVKPEYKCRWPLWPLSLETKVALLFGPTASKIYGPELTLYQGLQGKGDRYKTLLRESITALLNSYNNFNFPYSTTDIFLQFTVSLSGCNRTIQITAVRFKRANLTMVAMAMFHVSSHLALVINYVVYLCSSVMGLLSIKDSVCSGLCINDHLI